MLPYYGTVRNLRKSRIPYYGIQGLVSGVSRITPGRGPVFLEQVVPLGISTKVALLSQNLDLDSMNPSSWRGAMACLAPPGYAPGSSTARTGVPDSRACQNHRYLPENCVIRRLSVDIQHHSCTSRTEMRGSGYQTISYYL